MTKKLTWKITTIVLFVVAMFLLLAGITLTGTMKVSAAEDNDAAPMAVNTGWYMVGNGAGVLEGDDWTKKSDLRLTGTALDTQNYQGFWRTSSVLMYAGDQFQFQYSTDTTFAKNYSAGYSNLENSGAYSSFVNGGQNNIQAKESGYYIFRLNVAQGTNGVVISLSVDSISTTVPSKTLFDMYVVGSIPYYPTCQWPNNTINAEAKCIPMTLDKSTQTWESPTIYLSTSDSFKVMNVITGNYYPGSVDNHLHISRAGYYTIAWTEGESTIDVYSSAEPTPPSTVMTPGWYVVGNGAGALKYSRWNRFLPELRLNGASTSPCVYNDYYGTWTIGSVLLYQGDQFKVVHNNGDRQSTHLFSWDYELVADYNTFDDGEKGLFEVAGADYNIQVMKSGYYSLKLTMSYGPVTGVTLHLTATLVSTNVPSIPTMDMYVVGYIASVPTCGWPGLVGNVATDCIHMAYNPETGVWRTAEAVYLTTRDSFKVYNLANNSYYPSGNGQNGYVNAPGWYYIEWSFANSQNLTLISTTAP